MYTERDILAIELQHIKIEFMSDDSFLLLKDGKKLSSVILYNIDGTKQKEWKILSNEPLDIVNKLIIDDELYLLCSQELSEIDQLLILFKSQNDGTMKPIITFPRENYRHNMAYYKLIDVNGECRFLLIRHNRIHMFSVGEKLTEIEVMYGDKWFISDYHVINVTRDEWEVYNLSFDLITTISNVKGDYSWVSTSMSEDGNIIAIVADNPLSLDDDARSCVCIYDKVTSVSNIRYLDYNCFAVAVCGEKVWVSVGHDNFLNFGGISIYDRAGYLEYSQISDGRAHGKQNAFYPEPISSQADYISEINNNAVILVNQKMITISDFYTNKIQELDYDTYAITDDKKKLAVMMFYDYETKETGISAKIEVFEWDMNSQRSNIVDIASYLR